MKKVSIIVCTYNREDFIEKCLTALNNQSQDNNDYEVILINNNSTDATNQICLDFKEKHTNLDLKYFIETKQGLSSARNRGIKEANSPIISFIDDDVIVNKDYVSEIINFFSKHKNVDALGGKILPLYESERPKWMSVFLEPLMSVIDLGDKEKKFPKNKFPIGANMIFDKKIFDKIGLFNENLGRTGKNMLGGEEKDIFNRIKSKNGVIWYSNKPWVFHQVPNERLSLDFIKNQALAIGYSEKIRALNISRLELSISILKEMVKWGASFILYIYYSLLLQFPKAKMIIKFRYWVTSGFFKNKI